MNLARALYVAAMLLVAAGAALRLTPVEQPTASAAGTARMSRDTRRAVIVPASSSPAEIDAAADDPLIAANIFSRSRVAPARVPATGTSPTARQHSAGPARAPTFTLYGTTVGPRGAAALIDVSTTPGGAQVHYMGDLLADARLVSIADSTVTLIRPSGPLVLHISPGASRSP